MGMAAATDVAVAFRYVVLAATMVLVAGIPTTLDGPFAPTTVAFNPSLRQGSSDLPPTDPRLVKSVLGNQPEQISLALSNPGAIWVTWITGIINPTNTNSFWVVSLETHSLAYMFRGNESCRKKS